MSAEDTHVAGSSGSADGAGEGPDGDQQAGADADAERERPRKKGSFWKELPILIVIALVLTFLIQTFLARVFVIPSGSMEQTLHGCPGCTDDRIVVDKVVYDFSDPEPGDVVVFKGPKGWDQTEYTVPESSNIVVHWLRQFGSSLGLVAPDEYDLVKRVIAVGGQTVSCCDDRGRVMVDGRSLNEPYLYFQPGHPNWPTDDGPQQYPGEGQVGRQAYFRPITVPQGDIFVMGDNRNNSEDSRYQNGGGIHGVVPLDNVIGKARFIIWPPSRWGGISDYNPQQHAVALPSPGIAPTAPLAAGVAGAWPVLLVGRSVARRLRRRGRKRRP